MLALQAEEGEGLGNPSEPQPPPFTAQPTHEEPIPNIESSSPQKTQSPRQALNKDTELPQTSLPIPNVSDEVVHQERGDSVERADGGPRRQETIGVPLFKLGLRGHLNFPMIHHSEEGSSFGNRLKGRMIEEIDQDVGVTLVTPIKVSSQEDQPEDQLGVLSAAKVLAYAARVHTYSRRRRVVSTGSGGVSTASRIVSTAGMIQQVNIIIPSSSATKDKVIRLQEQLNEEESQRINRDAKVAQRLQEEFDAAEKQKIAQIHQAAQDFIEDEWEDIRARFEADEELTQKLQ
ncbi:hypothetical protein Tco_1055581 [Tanacetum coccineum]|uniref:Uncharacterized protein n=1 Tax=Tanacetum coccineum TaxID=301880 RepID=A0ABQ5H1B3_9ASTR